MWNWIKKIAIATVAVVAIVAVTVATGGIGTIAGVASAAALVTKGVVIGAVAGTVAGAAIGGIEAAANGKSVVAGVLDGVVEGAAIGGVAGAFATAAAVGATIAGVSAYVGTTFTSAAVGAELATLVAGGVATGVYAMSQNQSSNQNQQNANQKQAAATALEKGNNLKAQADSSVTKTEKLSKLQDAVKEYVKYTAFHGTNNEAGRIKTALEVQIRTLTSEQAAAAIALERANSLKVQADSSVIKAEKLSKLQDAVKEYVKYTAFHGTNNEAGRIKTALEVQIRTLTSEQAAAKAAHDLNEQARILVAEANIASGSEKIKKYEAAAAKFHSAYLTNRGSATNDAVYLANEAIALNGAGNHTEALKIADKALGLDANNTSAKAQKTAAENGIAAKAAHDLNEQARILLAEANIASGSEKIKKYEAAAAKFHSAYLTNRGSATNDAVYLANEAIALNGAGNHIEALKIADKALGLDANNTRAKEQKLLACIAKAKSENQNEDYSEAIKSADAALSIDHNNFAAKNQKIHSCVGEAIMFYKNKDYGKACLLLKNALTIDANHPNTKAIQKLKEHYKELYELDQQVLNLQKQNNIEKAKQATLRHEIGRMEAEQSDLDNGAVFQEQFNSDNDFTTRDAYMTVCTRGEEIESLSVSMSGCGVEDVHHQLQS